MLPSLPVITSVRFLIFMLVAGNQMQQGGDIQIFIESSIKMGSFVLSNVFAILDKMQYRSGIFQGRLLRKLISK